MNERLLFDLEANGFGEINISQKGEVRPEATTVHCLVIRDLDDPQRVDAYRNRDNPLCSPGYAIEDACRRLVAAKYVTGHNVIGYDLTLLKRLYPKEMEGFNPKTVEDTLILSQLLAVERRGHSLESWGETLEEPKGDFNGPWDKWTAEMEDYCIQDTATNFKIWQALQGRRKRRPLAPEPVIALEHEVSWIIAKQTERGWYFDATTARNLIATLTTERDATLTKLWEMVPPEREYMKTPQYWEDPEDGTQYAKKGDAPAKIRKRLVAGPPRFKEIPFNPGSGQQIAKLFISKYGWKPEKMTPGGEPATDEAVLSLLSYEEAKLILAYKALDKKLGMLQDRLLRATHSRDGRIHGGVMTLGAVTHRMSHSQPNDANVDSDPRIRGLYQPTPGLTLVGADAQGLEMRLLSSDMARYDKGAFLKDVLEGDPHAANQKAFKCDTRDRAKTIFYALIYGAQPYKIGVEICGETATVGQRIIDNFRAARPAYAQLVDRMAAQAESMGLIQLVDGRWVQCRKKHAVLNTRLQGSGSVFMKVALVLFNRALEQEFPDTEWYFVGNIHDEWQLEVDPTIADRVIELACSSMEKAGKVLKLRSPMAGAGQKGASWAETH